MAKKIKKAIHNRIAFFQNINKTFSPQDITSDSVISADARSKTFFIPSTAPLTMAIGNNSGIKSTHCINIETLYLFIILSGLSFISVKHTNNVPKIDVVM